MAAVGPLVKPRLLRLIVPSGQGKATPQIGQSLGSLGLNMMLFLKEFNAKSVEKGYKDGIPLRVIMNCRPGSPKFDFELYLPPTSWFIKRTVGIAKGTGLAGQEVLGQIHVKEIYEIAKIKQSEEKYHHISVESFARAVAAQCRTCGVEIMATKSDSTPKATPAAKVATKTKKSK